MSHYVNVFGKPVTVGTRSERAKKALDNPNVDRKRDQAIVYVKGKKAAYGDATSTLCIFYNATGETLTYVADRSWNGEIYGDTYPPKVENGQWGAFLYVWKAEGSTDGSLQGSVVYRQKQAENYYANQQLLGWHYDPEEQKNTKPFCDIYADVNQVINWEVEVNEKIKETDQTSHRAEWNGIHAYATIIDEGQDSSTLYKAILSLEVYNPAATGAA